MRPSPTRSPGQEPCGLDRFANPSTEPAELIVLVEECELDRGSLALTVDEILRISAEVEREEGGELK